MQRIAGKFTLSYWYVYETKFIGCCIFIYVQDVTDVSHTMCSLELNYKNY